MRTLSSSRMVPVDDEGTALSQAPQGMVESDSMHARRCWSEWAQTASRFEQISVASILD